jgi:hypothetical protein
MQDARQLSLFPEPEKNDNTEFVLHSDETAEPNANKNTIADAEWCFQFFENDPVVFAWQNEGEQPGPMVLRIEPTTDDKLTFSFRGMNFSIFPRPISEETKRIRSQQNEAEANTK